MVRNIEERRRWQREYYNKKKNIPEYKEMLKRIRRNYYLRNKEKYRISHKKYFESHKEQYRKYRREWRYNNPAGIYATIKDGLDRKKMPRKILVKISKEEFIEWYNSQEQICFYCKRIYEETRIEAKTYNNGWKVNRLTIDRVDNTKGYEKGNIVLACSRCNSIKGNYFSKDEMLRIGEIIRGKI